MQWAAVDKSLDVKFQTCIDVLQGQQKKGIFFKVLTKLSSKNVEILSIFKYFEVWNKLHSEIKK